MFNKLFLSLSGMASFTAVITWIQNLLVHLENDIKDPNLKNDAINAMIDILQAAKTAVPEVSTKPL
jgi:hypothetical protein